MKRLFATLLLWLWTAFAFAGSGDAIPLPQLKARVTDLTGTLSSEQRQSLENALTQFEQRKGSQIAVLLLPTTKPENIEQFSIRLAEAWRIGRKGVDDGVIVVVAKDDRALRIEVGYGLEGALNDATAKRIISDVMVPALKQGDFSGALQKGVAAIISVVDRESLPAVSSGSGSGLPTLNDERGIFLMIGMFVVAVGGALVRYFLGNLLGASLVGVVIGAIGWFVAGMIGAVVGLLGGFFVAMFGMDILQMMGAFSGGGGSSRGSGGFGGGGGGFGGGGASGSW